ncbi:hypothetical protein V1511DRAFT_385310 [Dipodascopsis uninucleata]
MSSQFCYVPLSSPSNASAFVGTDNNNGPLSSSSTQSKRRSSPSRDFASPIYSYNKSALTLKVKNQNTSQNSLSQQHPPTKIKYIEQFEESASPNQKISFSNTLSDCQLLPSLSSHSINLNPRNHADSLLGGVAKQYDPNMKPAKSVLVVKRHDEPSRLLLKYKQRTISGFADRTNSSSNGLAAWQLGSVESRQSQISTLSVQRDDDSAYSVLTSESKAKRVKFNNTVQIAVFVSPIPSRGVRARETSGTLHLQPPKQSRIPLRMRSEYGDLLELPFIFRKSFISPFPTKIKVPNLAIERSCELARSMLKSECKIECETSKSETKEEEKENNTEESTEDSDAIMIEEFRKKIARLQSIIAQREHDRIRERRREPEPENRQHCQETKLLCPSTTSVVRLYPVIQGTNTEHNTNAKVDTNEELAIDLAVEKEEMQSSITSNRDSIICSSLAIQRHSSIESVGNYGSQLSNGPLKFALEIPNTPVTVNANVQIEIAMRREIAAVVNTYFPSYLLIPVIL